MNVSILRPTRSSSPARPTDLLGVTLAALLPLGCFDPAPIADSTETEDGSGTESAGTGDTSSLDDESGVATSDGSGGAPAICGDGIVEGDEVCDDGLNNGSYGGCTPDCDALAPHCGDGLVNGGEACDDGDEVDGDGCNVDCVVSGTVLWTVIYDGAFGSVDSGTGVETTSNDEILVTGSSSEDGQPQGLLRLFSPAGDTIWSATLPGPSGTSTATSVILQSTGTAVVGGNFEPIGSRPDAWIRSFSASGTPGWTEVFSGPMDAWDRVVTLSSDNNDFIYALIEHDQASTATGYQTLLRKYFPDGSETWTQFHGSETRARHMSIDSEGYIVLASTTGSNAVISKFDSDGTEIWSTTVGPAASLTNYVSTSTSGDIAVVVSPPDSDERIIRLDASGNQTDVVFPSLTSGIEFVGSLHYDNSNLLVAGGTSVNGEATAAWVAKYTSQGSLTWSNFHDGQFDNFLSFDRVLAITTDSQNNVIATGAIHNTPGNNSDMLVVKYAP